MKTKFLFSLIITIFLVFALPVLATITEVSTSSSVTRATTGTDITVSVVTTSSESDTADIRLIVPSEISISDPSNQYYPSVSVTGQVTKTFTISAGTAGTYSDIYGQATPTGQSPVSSTPITIVFEDPGALTISGSPSSNTKNRDDSFTLSITISNPQASDITTYYALTCPSEISCSGDLASNTITVVSSSSTSLQWTATISSSATAGAKTISFQLGDTEDAFTSTVTVSVPSGGVPGGGGFVSTGGFSGVRVTRTRGNANITIPSIAAGKMANVTIIKTEDLAVRQINISVVNSVNNIKMSITKLPRKPAVIIKEITGKVYHYMNISKEKINDTDINKVYIDFAVDKTWITENNIDKTTIRLNRWVDNQWDALTTTQINETEDEILFRAISSGLSYFAISGYEIGYVPPCTESWSCEDWSECFNGTQIRRCTDANACGTTVNKPAVSQACEMIGAEISPVTIDWKFIAFIAVIIAVFIIVIIGIGYTQRKKLLSKSKKPKKSKNRSAKIFTETGEILIEDETES